MQRSNTKPKQDTQKDYITSVSHIKNKKKTIKLKAKAYNKKVVTPKVHTEVILQPTPHKKPLEIMISKFKQFFKDDLLGFIGKPQPKFRVITSGGYGLKTLVEEKYKLFGKIKTDDLDLTVSTYKSSLTPQAAFNYWTQKVQEFIYAQGNPDDFRVKIVNFGGDEVPIFNFRRYFVIMISYKIAGEFTDFVDVAITNVKVTNEMIEHHASFKAGIPIKNEEHYLKEFLTLIYMENTPGVYEFCYKKRNPVEGDHPEKGIKDIDRSKLICHLKKKNRYHRYCRLLRQLTINKLKTLSKQQRDIYFKSIEHIV